MFSAALKSGAAAAPVDPDFDYVTMLLHGDGTNGAQNNTFLDSSTNNFTITRNGNTTQGSFSPYGPNWSNYFDGSGDYLTTATSASAFSFGTGDFTIEFWINSTQTARCDPVGQDTAFSSSGWWGLIANLSSSGQLQWFENTNSRISATATNWNNGSWNHIAVTRSGNSVRMFVNGTQVGSTYTTSFTYGASNVGVIAGVLSDDKTTGPLTGYLSNLRIVKGTALYTGTFTPSTTPLTAVSGTSLLTCADNRFIDDSTNNLTITRTGDVSVQRFSPFAPTAAYSPATIGGSGYFDGSGDYLVVGNGALTLNPRTDVFTFESWVYWTTGTSGVIFGSASTTGFYIFLDGTIYVGDGSNNPITAAGSVRKNEWTYVALSFDGTTYRLYINNAFITSTATLLASNTVTACLGAYNNGATAFGGYLANARLVKGFALYTGPSITVPTSPISAVSGTSFLLNFTNGAIFDNAMMNDLETVGNAQISTSVVKFGTGSLAFDGNGDYLVLPPSPNLAFGVGNFTVEGWIYLNGTQNFGAFFMSSTTGAGDSLHIQINNANQVRITNQTTQFLVATNAIPTSTWTHIAIVRNGSTLTIYQNGVANGSTTNTTNFIQNGGLVGLEPVGGSFFLNGYIDDLRVTRGVARYTANFTPPTAAFPDR